MAGGQPGKGRLGVAIWTGVGPGEPRDRGGWASDEVLTVPQVAAILLPAGAASPPREEGGRRWAE